MREFCVLMCIPREKEDGHCLRVAVVRAVTEPVLIRRMERAQPEKRMTASAELVLLYFLCAAGSLDL